MLPIDRWLYPLIRLAALLCILSPTCFLPSSLTTILVHPLLYRSFTTSEASPGPIFQVPNPARRPHNRQDAGITDLNLASSNSAQLEI